MADCGNIFKGKFRILGFDMLDDTLGWVEKLHSPSGYGYDLELFQNFTWLLPSGEQVREGVIGLPAEGVPWLIAYIYFSGSNTLRIMHYYLRLLPDTVDSYLATYRVEEKSPGQFFLYDGRDLRISVACIS